MMAAEIAPEDWYLARIKNAQSHDDLCDVALNIDYDKWEEEKYTQDAEVMRKLREAFAARRKKLAQIQSVVPKAN